MKQNIKKISIVNTVIICILLFGFGTLVFVDAATHFSFYKNAVGTYARVTEKDYTDKEETRFDMTLAYLDEDGNGHELVIKDVNKKLANYLISDSVYMFYNSKDPDVADTQTRNIYVMGIIILICYAGTALAIFLLLKESKRCKRINSIIDMNNKIQADFSYTSMKSGKNVMYSIHATAVKDDKEYEFVSMPIVNNPESIINKKHDGKVDVFVDKDNYNDYVVDVTEYC